MWYDMIYEMWCHHFTSTLSWHMHMHIYIHTFIHTYMQSYIHTYMHTYAYLCIHSQPYIHSYIHILIYICIYTYFINLLIAEIERRILYKSEYWEGFFFIKSLLHLDNPAPNIVGTALLSLISCLERNGSDYNKRYLASDVWLVVIKQFCNYLAYNY